MPFVIQDMPKILRGYHPLTESDFHSGIKAAAFHLSHCITSPSEFRMCLSENSQFNELINVELLPHLGFICGTEFQVLAERAVEKIFNETIPTERRVKYKRADKEFVRNGGAYLRKAKEYFIIQDDKKKEEEKEKKRMERKAMKPKKSIGKTRG